MKELGSRTDLKISDNQDSGSASEVSSEFEDEDMGTGRSTPASEDSTDKVPVFPASVLSQASQVSFSVT